MPQYCLQLFEMNTENGLATEIYKIVRTHVRL